MTKYLVARFANHEGSHPEWQESISVANPESGEPLGMWIPQGFKWTGEMVVFFTKEVEADSALDAAAKFEKWLNED